MSYYNNEELINLESKVAQLTKENEELREMLLLTYSSVRKDYKSCTMESGLNRSCYSDMILNIQEGGSQ